MANEIKWDMYDLYKFIKAGNAYFLRKCKSL